jgi:hypothetical protein
MAFYVELVDAAGARHWYDVMGGDNVQDALDGAHGLANCDPCLEGEGMTFRAYPLNLDVPPAATLPYSAEVF